MEKKSFDLASLEQSDSTTFNLRHPVTDEDIPGVTATVYGQDSDTYRKADRVFQEKFQDYARKHRGKFMKAESREVLDTEKLLACTKSIDGLVLGGKPITDPAEILARVPAFREQLLNEIHDRSNFMKDSSQK